MTRLPISNVNLQNSVSCTAAGEANMASGPRTEKTDWLPKLADFCVSIFFRVRQPNFRTAFQRCLLLHRLTKLLLQSISLLCYTVQTWNLLPLSGAPKNRTNAASKESPVLLSRACLPGKHEYCTQSWNTLSTE